MSFKKPLILGFLDEARPKEEFDFELVVLIVTLLLFDGLFVFEIFEKSPVISAFSRVFDDFTLVILLRGSFILFLFFNLLCDPITNFIIT